MNYIARIVWLSVIAVMVTSPVFAQSARLDDEEIVKRVEDVLERVMQQPETVGFSLAVARDDKLLFEAGRGMADLEFEVPADQDTVFRIGSVTKQFTAAAIMNLVESKKLKLDSPVNDLLPDVDLGDHTVTVRQLLNHTSGIPNSTAHPGFFKSGSALDATHDEFLAFVKDVPFDFEPGESWSYSNTGYYFLGMVVEAVDGRPYAEFLQDEFFDPLGLTRTRFGSARDIIPNRAQGYVFAPVVELTNDPFVNMETLGAAGGLISTAGDLVRWQIALTEGRVVSEASYRKMVDSGVPVGPDGSTYGFGLAVTGTGEGRRIGHAGGIPGFNSMLVLLPERDMHVAMISNSHLASTVVVELILSAISSAEPPEAPRKAPKAGAEAAVKRLIGELAKGEPDYSLMSEGLAGLTQSQLPHLQPLLAGMGSIESIDFNRVSLEGADVFDVTFANGSIVYTISLRDDGIVERATFWVTSSE